MHVHEFKVLKLGVAEGSAFLNKNGASSIKNDILDVVVQRDFISVLSKTRAVVRPKASSVETLVRVSR